MPDDQRPDDPKPAEQEKPIVEETEKSRPSPTEKSGTFVDREREWGETKGGGKDGNQD